MDVTDHMEEHSEMKLRVKVASWGLVYGELVYRIALVGMILGTVGILIVWAGGPSFADHEQVLRALWRGERVAEIWIAGGVPASGHWYLRALGSGDGVAMLGVVMCCAASLVGTWGAVVTMLTARGRERAIHIFIALVVAVVLTVSALTAQG